MPEPLTPTEAARRMETLKRELASLGNDHVPTPRAIERVQQDIARARGSCSRTLAITYIQAADAGNLICLDCGSENHTRGNLLCNHATAADRPEAGDPDA